MSYPNNVLSLGHGPARHLPCGADDAYLEDLDREAKRRATECDAHVRAHYIQQMQAICEDYGDWNDGDASTWYSFSVAELDDALGDIQAYYHGGQYAWDCGYPGNAHLPNGGDE